MLNRFSKKDWLDIGLKTLAKDGPRAIRIDNLCKLASRTKGSFYHHFIGRKDFVTNLLTHWEQELTQRVIDQANQGQSPVARLIMLNKITTDFDGGVERELRRWAGTNPAVEVAIANVDKRRVNYVASLLMQAKDISSSQAIDLAVMNYAALIGFQQIFTPLQPERRKRIDQLYVDILSTLPDHK